MNTHASALPTLSDQERAELRRLEEDMWREGARFDPEFQEARFAHDFFEFGRSGRVYTRAQSMHHDAAPIQAKLPLPSLAFRMLDTNTVQLTYDSEVVYNGVPEYARRSSIWSRTSGGWVMRFHQGTPFTP